MSWSLEVSGRRFCFSSATLDPVTTQDDPKYPSSTYRDDRRAAAIAGHEGDQTTARQLLESADDRVRATALGALERSGALRPSDLQAALADGSARVRRRAVTIAAGYPDVEIANLLDDPDHSVAEVAAWSCGERLEAPNVATVVTSLITMTTEHPDPLCREAAVASLGALGDDRAVDAILSALTDIPQIRRRAALALAPFDDPQVTAALEAALDDKDWQVRQAAEDLLGR